MVVQPEDPELESNHNELRDFTLASAREQPTARSRSGTLQLKEFDPTSKSNSQGAVNEKKLPGMNIPLNKVYVEEKLGKKADEEDASSDVERNVTKKQKTGLEPVMQETSESDGYQSTKTLEEDTGRDLTDDARDVTKLPLTEDQTYNIDIQDQS